MRSRRHSILVLLICVFSRSIYINALGVAAQVAGVKAPEGAHASVSALGRKLVSQVTTITGVGVATGVAREADDTPQVTPASLRSAHRVLAAETTPPAIVPIYFTATVSSTPPLAPADPRLEAVHSLLANATLAQTVYATVSSRRVRVRVAVGSGGFIRDCSDASLSAYKARLGSLLALSTVDVLVLCVVQAGGGGGSNSTQAPRPPACSALSAALVLDTTLRLAPTANVTAMQYRLAALPGTDTTLRGMCVPSPAYMAPAGASLDVVLSMPDPTRLYAAAATAAAASPPPMPPGTSGLSPPPPPAVALGNTSNIDNGSGDAAAFLSRVVEALTSDLQLAIALGMGVPLEQVQVVPGTLQMRLPPSPPPSPPLPPPLPPLPSPSALPVVVVRDPNTVGTFESSRQWSIPIIISLSVAAGLVALLMIVAYVRSKRKRDSSRMLHRAKSSARAVHFNDDEVMDTTAPGAGPAGPKDEEVARQMSLAAPEMAAMGLGLAGVSFSGVSKSGVSMSARSLTGGAAAGTTGDAAPAARRSFRKVLSKVMGREVPSDEESGIGAVAAAVDDDRRLPPVSRVRSAVQQDMLKRAALRRLLEENKAAAGGGGHGAVDRSAASAAVVGTRAGAGAGVGAWPSLAAVTMKAPRSQPSGHKGAALALVNGNGSAGGGGPSDDASSGSGDDYVGGLTDSDQQGDMGAAAAAAALLQRRSATTAGVLSGGSASGSGRPRSAMLRSGAGNGSGSGRNINVSFAQEVAVEDARAARSVSHAGRTAPGAHHAAMGPAAVVHEGVAGGRVGGLLAHMFSRKSKSGAPEDEEGGGHSSRALMRSPSRVGTIVSTRDGDELAAAAAAVGDDGEDGDDSDDGSALSERGGPDFAMPASAGAAAAVAAAGGSGATSPVASYRSLGGASARSMGGISARRVDSYKSVVQDETGQGIMVYEQRRPPRGHRSHTDMGLAGTGVAGAAAAAVAAALQGRMSGDPDRARMQAQAREREREREQMSPDVLSRPAQGPTSPPTKAEPKKRNTIAGFFLSPFRSSGTGSIPSPGAAATAAILASTRPPAPSPLRRSITAASTEDPNDPNGVASSTSPFDSKSHGYGGPSRQGPSNSNSQPSDRLSPPPVPPRRAAALSGRESLRSPQRSGGSGSGMAGGGGGAGYSLRRQLLSSNSEVMAAEGLLPVMPAAHMVPASLDYDEEDIRVEAAPRGLGNLLASAPSFRAARINSRTGEAALSSSGAAAGAAAAAMMASSPQLGGGGNSRPASRAGSITNPGVMGAAPGGVPRAVGRRASQVLGVEEGGIARPASASISGGRPPSRPASPLPSDGGWNQVKEQSASGGSGGGGTGNRHQPPKRRGSRFASGTQSSLMSPSPRSREDEWPAAVASGSGGGGGGSSGAGSPNVVGVARMMTLTTVGEETGASGRLSGFVGVGAGMPPAGEGSDVDAEMLALGMREVPGDLSLGPGSSTRTTGQLKAMAAMSLQSDGRLASGGGGAWGTSSASGGHYGVVAAAALASDGAGVTRPLGGLRQSVIPSLSAAGGGGSRSFSGKPPLPRSSAAGQRVGWAPGVAGDDGSRGGSPARSVASPRDRAVASSTGLMGAGGRGGGGGGVRNGVRFSGGLNSMDDDGGSSDGGARWAALKDSVNETLAAAGSELGGGGDAAQPAGRTWRRSVTAFSQRTRASAAGNLQASAGTEAGHDGEGGGDGEAAASALRAWTTRRALSIRQHAGTDSGFASLGTGPRDEPPAAAAGGGGGERLKLDGLLAAGSGGSGSGGGAEPAAARKGAWRMHENGLWDTAPSDKSITPLGKK